MREAQLHIVSNADKIHGYSDRLAILLHVVAQLQKANPSPTICNLTGKLCECYRRSNMLEGRRLWGISADLGLPGASMGFIPG